MSIATLRRHPTVPLARHPLTEVAQARQLENGIFTVERGERFPIPVDRISDLQEFKSGRFAPADVLTYEGRPLWRRDENGSVRRPGTRLEPTKGGLRQDAAFKVLGYKPAMISSNLYAVHWHVGWANPFEPDRLEGPLDGAFETLFATHWPTQYRDALLKEKVLWMARPEEELGRLERHRVRQLEKLLRPQVRDHECRLPTCPADVWPDFRRDALPRLRSLRGFVEDLGWLSGALVTDAFVSEIVDELVSATATEFADFDFHEVGTNSAAENNDHTALQTSSGIARATGSPTDSDPDYDNAGTITADATETWEEHGLFNNSTSVALMDRNLTGGQAVNSSDQITYTLSVTVNPET